MSAPKPAARPVASQTIPSTLTTAALWCASRTPRAQLCASTGQRDGLKNRRSARQVS